MRRKRKESPKIEDKVKFGGTTQKLAIIVNLIFFK